MEKAEKGMDLCELHFLLANLGRPFDCLGALQLHSSIHSPQRPFP
jgi:hypothetical protein